MKKDEILVSQLREQYLKLMHQIAVEKFALATLPLDEKEKSLLDTQIWSMRGYADKLAERAAYIKKAKGQIVGDEIAPLEVD